MAAPSPSPSRRPPAFIRWLKSLTSSSHSNSDPSTKSTSRGKGKSVRPVYQPPSRGLPVGAETEGRVFGVALEDSLKYASVAISMIGPDNQPYIYGYIPIIVAKAGMLLKSRALHTQGIFRVSGSTKRINQLQAIFDTDASGYGKNLDWGEKGGLEGGGYTVHDAASVLRRYLNMMPDPVIPQDLYLSFVAVLRKSLPLPDTLAAFHSLIELLPPSSKYLLLYLLDFLSLFAQSSADNLMNASNLATVFQPGLVSTRSSSARKEGGRADGSLLGFPGFEAGVVPSRPGSAGNAGGETREHSRAKEVLEFLIEQQAHFVLGIELPVASRNPSPTTVARSGSKSKGRARTTQESERRFSGEVDGRDSIDVERREEGGGVKRSRSKKAGQDGGVARTKSNSRSKKDAENRVA